MKFFRKPLFILCTFAFSIALAPPTQAVDGCSAAGFKVPTSIYLGGSPFGLATADVNGDGHLDLIAALNNGSSDLTILFGRGGTDRFGPPINFPAGGQPRKITVGDLNGDGKPDLVVAIDDVGAPSGKLSVLLNDGTGNFGAPNLINLTGDPERAVLGDLNNDGKLDIVTGLYTGTTDGTVAVLLGNGAGGFSQAPNSPFPTYSTTAYLVVIGDFNEDGKRDLAVPNVFGAPDILLGDGTGRFAPAVPPQLSGGAITLTAGDFNEDGHLDLLVLSRMFLGTGTGSFAAPVVVPIPANTNATRVGDVNHDGHLDVVAAGSGGLAILLGNGTGNLVQGRSYSSGFTVFGADSSFAVLGDFNEDTNVDLAAVLPQGIGILDGDGTGEFNDALSYHTTIARPHDLLAADFNNDGKQDFATTSSDVPPLGNKLEVALGDGSGRFTNKSVTVFGAQPSAIASADFNGDGFFDLAVTLPSNGRVTILLNDGTGGFTTDGFSAPSYTLGFQPSAIRTGDFNNDTKADLVVVTPGLNRLVLLLGDGSGAFTNTAGATLQGTSSFSDDLAIADFNADGKPDVAVVRSGANVVHVLQWNDGGFFSTMAIVPVPGLASSVVATDLNGDGKPDIAVTTSITGSSPSQSYVTVLLNNGASGFNPGTNYATEVPGILGIGDFNGDTYPDLAVGSYLAAVGILTNKGDGDFNTAIYFSAGPGADHLAVRDFNNDGKDDVAISQPFGNSVGLLLNNFTTSQPCLSVDDVTVTENDLGSTTDAIFTVKLSSASAQTVRVNYFTTPAFLSGSTSAATKGADFDDTPGTVTFLPGETTQTITIHVKGDVTDEFDQYFYVVLTTPINAAISDGKGLGTIVDNDPPAAISINDVAVAEGTLTPSSAIFTVSLNAPSEKVVSVQYALAAGTATVTTDYANISGTVEFPVGTVAKTISVPIAQDNIFEPDETFLVDLSSATNATITDAQGQGTISNDDPQPGITIAANSSRIEGATGASGNSLFEVKLSNPSYQTITVSYETVDVTATAGADYVATSGSLTFNPGETSKTVTVVVSGDNIDEINETYVVNLTNPTNATIAAAQGVGTIQDDDGPTLSIGPAVVTEGNTGFTNANFTVTLSFASVQEVTVNYATVGGTATSGLDYQRVVLSTLFIPAGNTSGTISIRVFGDTQLEPDEQFFVNLTSPVNATIATAQGIGTIVNDDASIQLEFATYNFSEGVGNAQVHVKRTGDTTGASSINFSTGGNSFFACSTINGSAVQNCDFILNQGTLAFAAGQTDRSINLLVNDDTYVEGNETLTLTLSSPVNATIGSPGSATLTITDNDSVGATVPGAKTFIAALNAASEVPPTGTSGKGGGMVQLDAGETGGKAGLLFSNLSSAESAAHIHGPAAIGVNAPILFPLTLGTLTDFAFSPTSQQVTDLKAGQHYMNVHTNNFLNGEIRGQLLWNPLNEVDYFVTQHYYDFLGRLPDQSGFDFWTNEMKQCGINVQCFRDKSVDVSNAFFYEQEYQQTASYVFLLYRASYGNTQPFPNPDPANPTEANKLPRYLTFVRDRVQVVGGTNLAASQKALADAFVQRAEFIARYPLSLSTGPQFVDAVLATINTADGATFAAADRAALITHFNNGGRGLVMFHLANDYWNGCNRLPGNPAAPCVPAGFGTAVDNRAFIDAEYNRSFVYSQYSGYLRRDGDIDGFIFWLNQVSAAPPRNVAKQHGMVCSFITSAEYQQRFGVNAPRTNAECTP